MSEMLYLSLSLAQVEVESRGGKQKLLAKKDPKIPHPHLSIPHLGRMGGAGMLIASHWNLLVIAVELKTKTNGIHSWDFHYRGFHSRQLF